MKKSVVRVSVPILLVVELCSIVLMLLSYNNKDKLDINRIKLNGKIETFAIYKELTQGGSDWAKTDDTKFPDKGYILNTTQTKCYGYNDEPIEGVLKQNDDMSISISSNKTIYCNVYFDKDDTIPVINTFAIIGKEADGVTLTDSDLYSHTVDVGYTFNWTETNTSAYCITSGSTCESNEWVAISETSVSNAVKTLEPGDGIKTMNAFVKDKANNVSMVASDSIILDLTAPTVTISKSSVTTESITVTLEGSDGSGSGINSYQCRIEGIDDGAWKDAVLVGEKTYQCTISGLKAGVTYEIEGRTIDKSGRISTTQIVTEMTEKKIITASDLTKPENRPSGLSENELGDMYRFVGTKETVDNYVCFGYNDAATDCNQGETSDYMYRIIGITQSGQFKLIKNTAIRESGSSSEGRYRWWEDYSTDKKWPDSDIFLRLNGKGTGSSTGYTGNSNLFIDSTTSNVNYIKTSGDTTWYDKIEKDHSWWYGGIYGDSPGANKTANEMYQIETGQLATQQNYYENSAKWSASQKVEAAVGLMYLSDYYYSYAINGTNSSLTNCYSSSVSCVNSWLHISQNGKSSDYQDEWTITRYGRYRDGTFGARYVDSDGNIAYDYLYNRFSIRPIFFLTTEASEIEDGKGTASEPFIIVK